MEDVKVYLVKMLPANQDILQADYGVAYDGVIQLPVLGQVRFYSFARVSMYGSSSAGSCTMPCSTSNTLMAIRTS